MSTIDFSQDQKYILIGSTKRKENLFSVCRAVREARGIQGSNMKDILESNGSPDLNWRVCKSNTEANFTKTVPQSADGEVLGPETERGVLVLLHVPRRQPWEEKMGLLMLLLVVMAASSHLEGTKMEELEGKIWLCVYAKQCLHEPNTLCRRMHPTNNVALLPSCR